jgi:hypothetical protein
MSKTALQLSKNLVEGRPYQNCYRRIISEWQEKNTGSTLDHEAKRQMHGSRARADCTVVSKSELQLSKNLAEGRPYQNCYRRIMSERQEKNKGSTLDPAAKRQMRGSRARADYTAVSKTELQFSQNLAEGTAKSTWPLYGQKSLKQSEASCSPYMI